MADKVKYYVVWVGRKPGIYSTWEACSKQIHGFPGAKYRSFPSMEQAKIAFASPPLPAIKKTGSLPSVSNRTKLPRPIGTFLCVDASWITTTGASEYRGVMMPSGEVIFSRGPFQKGTNNVVEFIAIVHALAWCKQKDSGMTIYSDSATAIAWLRKKKANSKLNGEGSDELLELLYRAEKWIRENTWSNAVLKWETEQWGEIPADYGRK